MTGMRLRNRPALTAAFVLGLVASLAEAATPDEALVNKIVELNKKALVRYEGLDMEGAAALLREAIQICSKGNLEHHTVAARTHLHLGVVYVSGLNLRELGLAEFRKALAIDPGIRVAKSLSNPEVERVFAEAQAVATLQPTEGRALPFPTGLEARPASATELGDDAIFHPPVVQAVRDQPVPVKVQIPAGLGAGRAVLAYRAEHGDEFLARDMLPVPDATTWYRAEIPAVATRGNWVVYYIEARKDDDEILARSGTPDAPHRLALAPRPIQGTDGRGRTRDRSASTSGPHNSLWLVLAMGTGGGYHSGSPEMNPRDTSVPANDLHVSGFAAARTFHAAPELGYFHSERLILSAQARLQIVGGTQDVTIVDSSGSRTYRPARMAFAGFLKATWLPRKVGRRMQPLVFAQAGAGQLRHTVETPAGVELSGCGESGRCRDTVLGGPFLAGGGVGATYRLIEHVGLYAALTVLAGIPNVLVEADANVGVAFAY